MVLSLNRFGSNPVRIRLGLYSLYWIIENITWIRRLKEILTLIVVVHAAAFRTHRPTTPIVHRLINRWRRDDEILLLLYLYLNFTAYVTFLKIKKGITHLLNFFSAGRRRRHPCLSPNEIVLLLRGRRRRQGHKNVFSTLT